MAAYDFTVWHPRVYDRGGIAKVAADYRGLAGSTNDVRYPFQEDWTLPLNGMDTYDFQLRLDDPMAAQMSELDTIVKIWRDVNDPEYGASYTRPAGFPDYCGVVYYARKQGAGNVMQVKTASPFFFVQCRFHLLNHRLVLNNLPGDAGFGDPWDQSALMWKHIDLINNAFGVSSQTGIVKGSWPTTIAISPFFIPQGEWTWSLLTDNLLNRPSAVDFDPVYLHTDGSPELMMFSTSVARGEDRTGSVSLDYLTGNKNCEDMGDSVEVRPGIFANYGWAIGQGDANSNKVGIAYDSSASGYGYHAVGVFMAQWPHPEGTTRARVQAIADSEILKSKQPIREHFAVLSPTKPPYMSSHFYLGDVVALNGQRGAFSVSGLAQRIHEIKLTRTMNRTEICQVKLADDFKGKVAG